jgi:ribokinase
MGVENIILKRGAEGAVLATQGEISDSVAAFPVKVVDTTAAGDAFNGAFAVGLMRGNTVAASARFAAAAAAISVTRRGAQSSLPTESEVLSFLEAHAERVAELEG